MSAPAYDVPAYEREPAPLLRKVCDALRGILSGRLNVTVDVTLQASQTTTVVTDARLHAFAAVLWTPLTASASTAEKAGIWVSSIGKGTLTLTHASSAATDQTLRLVIIG